METCPFANPSGTFHYLLAICTHMPSTHTSTRLLNFSGHLFSLVNATMCGFKCTYRVCCLWLGAYMAFSSWQVSRSLRSTGTMLDTVDVCSLLFRLQMEGEAVSSGSPRGPLEKRHTRASPVLSVLLPGILLNLVIIC